MTIYFATPAAIIQGSKKFILGFNNLTDPSLNKWFNLNYMTPTDLSVHKTVTNLC